MSVVIMHVKKICWLKWEIIFICILFHWKISSAQIVFDSSFTAEQLVDKFISGQGVRAGNVTYTGPKESIGYFKCDNNAISVESGIFLSTGKIQDASGPNNSP